MQNIAPGYVKAVGRKVKDTARLCEAQFLALVCDSAADIGVRYTSSFRLTSCSAVIIISQECLLRDGQETHEVKDT